jgi:hypothetical protein
MMPAPSTPLVFKRWSMLAAPRLRETGQPLCTANDAFLFGSRRFRLERRPWSRPLAGNAGVRAGVEPDGGTNAAMAG